MHKILSPVRYLYRRARRFYLKPPSGVKAGVGVIVDRPRRRISAPDYITIGDRSSIGANALITPILKYEGVSYNPEIVIGKDVYIGPRVIMFAMEGITIGDGCVLSESVFLTDNNHGLDPDAGLIMKQPLVGGGKIVIGDHSFIGLRCVIMPGVVLGKHCVVGTNSVVTKSFPAYSMIAGAPARLVRRYCPKQKAWVAPDKVQQELSPEMVPEH